MTLELTAVLLLLGGVVGILAGLLGIGGGALMVPILTAIFTYIQFPDAVVVHLALGTSMACIITTSIASFMAHHRRGSVRWQIVKAMVPGILLGTFLATFIAAYAPPIYLAVFFALFMSYVALTMFIDKPAPVDANIGSDKQLAVAGSMIGAISALVSIGGGTLTVPYLSSRNVRITEAIGTSAACGFPIAVAGTLGYMINGIAHTPDIDYTIGFVYWPAVILISLSSYISAPLGVKFAHSLQVKLLKKIFALLVVVISINMIMSVVN